MTGTRNLAVGDASPAGRVVAPIINDGAGDIIWNADDIVTVAAPARRDRPRDAHAAWACCGSALTPA